MADEDLIRKGVELADGWRIGKTVFGTEIIVPPFISPDPEGIQGWVVENADVSIRDAVACQLIRQANAAVGWDKHYAHYGDPMEPIRCIINDRVLDD